MTVSYRGSGANSGLVTFRMPAALFEKYVQPYEEPYLTFVGDERRWVTQIPLSRPEVIGLLNRYLLRPDRPRP
jgi:hypothetical protein